VTLAIRKMLYLHQRIGRDSGHAWDEGTDDGEPEKKEISGCKDAGRQTKVAALKGIAIAAH